MYHRIKKMPTFTDFKKQKRNEKDCIYVRSCSYVRSMW